jgi:hypothetical protein
MTPEEIITRLKAWGRGFRALQSDLVTDTLEWETMEMRNIFAVLVLGHLIGLPTLPVHLSLELLDCIEPDLMIMLERMDTAQDALGELFSLLDIG